MLGIVPDNTTLAATDIIVSTARELHKPLIGGDLQTVKKGSLATYGYNYYELGQVTAEMVKEILIDRKNPAQMPVRYPPKASLAVNIAEARKYGIEIPKELLTQASTIIR